MHTVIHGSPATAEELLSHRSSSASYEPSPPAVLQSRTICVWPGNSGALHMQLQPPAPASSDYRELSIPLGCQLQRSERPRPPPLANESYSIECDQFPMDKSALSLSPSQS